MNNSTLPTMEQMTAVYLFGQLEKPSNLIDENLVRPTASVGWATCCPRV